MAKAERVERVVVVDQPSAQSRRAERGPGSLPVGRTARRYLTTVHPDHGEPVTFVPGELLPAWAVDAHDRAERDEVGQ